MNENKDKYLSLFVKIAIGFLLIAIIFPFAVNQFFTDWTKSGTFGDTFGALNALFSGLALAGVIVTILIQRTELKNQRFELALQREEMKETRKEFLLNRTTTLVYNQLDRFEKALSEFKLTLPNGTTIHGNDAILFLDENESENKVYENLCESEEAYKREMKESLINVLQIYTPNKSEIDKFAHSVGTSVDVLQRLIYKTDLEIEQLNDLKSLFFVNVGFVNMGVIERIAKTFHLQLDFLEAKDFLDKKNQISSNAVINAQIFLSSVTDFYYLRLTKENFNENKKKWISTLGSAEK